MWVLTCTVNELQLRGMYVLLLARQYSDRRLLFVTVSGLPCLMQAPAIGSWTALGATSFATVTLLGFLPITQ